MSPTAYDDWLGRSTAARTSRAATSRTPRRRLAYVVRAGAVLVGVAIAAVGFADPANATWSVVGTDPSTGQVGAAVASCVESRDLTTTMALVPRTGSAVSIDPSSGATPAVLAAALRNGGTPAEVTGAMRAADVDAASALRQYGVAVIGAGAGSSTGVDTAATSGARVSADGSASVQGNLVASPAVLDSATRAFDSTTGPLATRLLAALDAGSAAGGDRACGNQARAAALVVLGPKSALFVPATAGSPSVASSLDGGKDLTPAQIAQQIAEHSVLPAPRGPHAPVVYLSTVTAPGRDALAVLDTRYAALTAPAVPANAVAGEQIVDPAYSQGLTVAALILFGVIGLIIAALIITGLRRAERANAVSRADDEASIRKPYRGDVANLFDVDLMAARRRKRAAERDAATDPRNRESAWSGTSW